MDSTTLLIRASTRSEHTIVTSARANIARRYRRFRIRRILLVQRLKLVIPHVWLTFDLPGSERWKTGYRRYAEPKSPDADDS